MKKAYHFLGLLLVPALALGCSKKGSAKVSASAEGDVDASASVEGGGDDTRQPRGDDAWEGGESPQEEGGRLAEPLQSEVRAPKGVVTLPGFRMFRDGRSRVFVEIGGDVPIEESKAEGQLIYKLKGVRVPEKVNLFDLPTTYFNTPVSRVRLLQDGSDVNLIVELRQQTASKTHTRKGVGGTVLSIDFPPVGTATEASAKAPEQ